MISQFFILSPRGDTVIARDYLGNVPKSSSEVFYRKFRFWDGGGQDAPPVFNIQGVNYLHVKDGGVILVATTRENVSPSLVLEFLRRVGGIIKDYCGLLSEEAVRKNFVLIYELLDEVIDYGYPQNTSSEALKEFVLNEPTMIKQRKQASSSLFNTIGKGPTGVIKSVLDTTRTDGGRRDEIFVDIVERISCTFNTSGYIQGSQIDGAIQVKSYLAGNPAICIALNDNLAIGRREGPTPSSYGGYGSGDVVMLDDCNFHESVSLERFETERMLELHKPPDGEFALMNYRSTYDFKPPFRVYMTVEDDKDASNKAIIFVKVRAEYSPDKASSGLEVVVPMPREIQRVSCEYETEVRPPGNQTWDWQEKQHKLVWRHKKVQGGTEHILRVRVTLEDGLTTAVRQGIGPINLNFTIPMYCASKLQVRYLQILKSDKNYSPYRWVRYVTMSNSYVVRTR
jgi:AP-4 complex subunit mu-1